MKVAAEINAAASSANILYTHAHTHIYETVVAEKMENWLTPGRTKRVAGSWRSKRDRRPNWRQKAEAMLTPRLQPLQNLLLLNVPLCGQALQPKITSLLHV